MNVPAVPNQCGQVWIQAYPQRANYIGKVPALQPLPIPKESKRSSRARKLIPCFQEKNLRFSMKYLTLIKGILLKVLIEFCFVLKKSIKMSGYRKEGFVL